MVEDDTEFSIRLLIALFPVLVVGVFLIMQNINGPILDDFIKTKK